MTDDPMVPLAGARRFWADAERTGPPPARRRPVPDLTDFAAFAARTDTRDPVWLSPVLLAGLGVFCAGYSAVPGTGLLPLSQETRRVVLLVLTAVFVVAALVVLLRNLRRGDGELRRLHRRFLAHGILTEAFRTSLDVSYGESFQPAWVLIEARVPDEQAARLHAALDGWLAAVGTDPALSRRISGWFRAGSGLVPSEELFGPDAVGGYLAGPSRYGHWKIVLPRAGAGPMAADRGSWTVLPVRDAGEPSAPVPTIGSVR
ncbi:hypothetical protein [Jiangella rhizosphaerae]|uniref:Uncharacterized protein n=1 Tax=Jiangella rhizosphaerae TaxID=2293569 RepID=A0A418KH36_9ACTN|nr:hypothetical protein [Jiangella rhizosphaerae]RIQ11372.1 hypothetical protein DY240_28955 [Jiangella rhizosphaerae]